MEGQEVIDQSFLDQYLRSNPEKGKFYRIKAFGTKWRVIGSVGHSEEKNTKLEI